MGLSESLLDALEKTYLIRRERNTVGGYNYELSHDTLLAPVLKAKKKRVAEEEAQKRATELAAEEARIAQEKAEADRRRKRALVTAFIAGVLILLSLVATVFAIIKTNQAEQAASKAVVALIDAARKDILNLQYNAAFTKMKDAAALGSIKDSVAFELMEIAWFHHHSGHDDLAREPYNLAASLLSKNNLKGRIDFEKLDADRAQFLKARYFGEMVALKGGKFNMQGEKYGGEVDEYEASVADFQLSKYETTVWQYNLFCVANGRNITQRISKDGKTIGDNKIQPSWGWVGNNPVVYVSWYDAAEYANWLSLQMGKKPAYVISTEQDSLNENSYDDFKWTITPVPKVTGFRLPTELEWEFAARGGLRRDSFEYSGSNSQDLVAWDASNCDDRTQPIGAKKINGAGIFDMSGNAWEWCYDWSGDLPAENIFGARKGSDRVVRGGGVGSFGPSNCQVALRSSDAPDRRLYNYGFRLVFVP
ncbi:MAG: SUMF1/EgtB/PvdO family nonheme iron enzyme, partial [Saprospiraceae bacterium]|nr:SUMF1/EgtB/PvdO family nonheme iron enzyme [Saprospiraceae bacterium]